MLKRPKKFERICICECERNVGETVCNFDELKEMLVRQYLILVNVKEMLERQYVILMN